MNSSKPNARIYKPGEFIYLEGHRSDAVYMIEHGEVEVLRSARDGELHLLGILGPGKIFGEAGVILDHPHSTSMRAHSAAVISSVDRETFLGHFRDVPLAMPLLRMLCERLVEADRYLLTVSDSTGLSVDVAHVGHMRLLPGSDFMKNQFKQRDVSLFDLPFRVGRKAKEAVVGTQPTVNLAVVTNDLVNMAERHFAIRGQDGRLFVEDLSGTIGTLVNGRLVARAVQKRLATLNWGSNEIIAGAQDSPIRFLLVIERKAA